MTFGNGTEGKILGIGNLINHELPKLDNVLLVKGLTFNLISISQLCDQGMELHFNKSECLVINKKGEVLVRGIRSKNNCYKWVPQHEGQNGQQTRMLHTMLEHQEISNVLELPHFDSIDDRRSVSRRCFSLGNNKFMLNITLLGILLKRKLCLQKIYWLTKI